ncbi:hypothetical protein DASC09_048890 [Saccharomycopsis crataegensis]|uniref:alcohol dehydrogenase (NADP(+)) n=1 Tax=Saccharomycopsis crataegensis TaxID=43959 RepID=A0AAV5QS31_9ASCO|nr:hypothetical protein DASC09_048890 [Saccharomycopsis crataegensis]
MVYPKTFQGFAITDLSKWTETELIEYEPKVFDDYDVDIKIDACGICGSDVHTASSGWNTPALPLVVGHEVVGKVVAVGPKVTEFKVGDRVGCGAQVWACLKKTCPACSTDNEVYCPHWVDTYNCTYPPESGKSAGGKAMGGYASHIRVHEYFTFHIPESLKNEDVAPMLCAGITTYSPLVRNGAGPGVKVGCVSIGGLGHFAIMWAKALGAEVYVFSRGEKKREDAFKLGADHYIATGEKGWNEPIKMKLDFIVSSANSSEGFDLGSYLSCLKVGGKFISVGLPEKPFNVGPGSFIANASSLSSSHLGSRPEMKEMLKLAAEKGIKAWNEPIAISAAGVKEGLEKCHHNNVKYRVVLNEFDKAFD